MRVSAVSSSGNPSNRDAKHSSCKSISGPGLKAAVETVIDGMGPDYRLTWYFNTFAEAGERADEINSGAKVYYRKGDKRHRILKAAVVQAVAE